MCVFSALSSPAGIAYDANSNRIFVTDRTNNRVIQYTLTNPVVSAVIAGTNAAVPPNPLNAPTGIFYDASSNSLIIANRDANNIIQWFLATNTFLVIAGDPAGTAGTTLNRLSAPRGVTLDSNGNIIVADTGNNRIILFPSGTPTDGTKNGRIIAGTGTAGTGNDQLNNPSAVDIDAQGNLYVADTLNHRIQEFTCIQS